MPFDTTQITSPLNGNHPQYGAPCHPLCASAHIPAVVIKAAGFIGKAAQSTGNIGYTRECAPTLTARMDGNPCSDRGPQIVATNALTPWDVQSRRIYDENGKMAALYSGEGQGAHNGAVFIRAKVYDMQQRTDVLRKYDGICPTLTGRMGTGGHNVPIVHAYCIAGNTIDRKIENGGNGKGVLAETAYTLNTVDRHAVATIYGAKSYSEYEAGKVATLRASWGAYGGGSENLALSYSVVRRLTPTECERLQGLDDGYTEGGSDTARYKALGNGMAQPCADYVMRRIVECAKEVR